MAEEIQEVDASTEPQGEDKQTDWKAEARKWEARAKKSIAAEEELAALKQAQMTEQEKAIARAEKAESELAQYKAEAERLEAARRISQEMGVPFQLLDYCANAEAMEQFAQAYRESQPEPQQVPIAAPAIGTRVITSKDGGEPDPREAFKRFVADQLS